MKLAIVGTGISGLVAAYHLQHEHELTLYEAGDYVGGHTHTHTLERAGQVYRVDSGFIVFNDWTYPNFIRLLDELKVPSQPSAMSFSVKCERSGLEYNGTSLNTLFAQRRNLFRPSFLRMIRDILRFNREAPAWLEKGDETTGLGEYLRAGGYSQSFREHYIIPMGAAIWSANPARMLEFPARHFIRFFHNHGMLSVNQRPLWRVVQGGSQAYVQPLIQGFADRIRLNTAVERVQRRPDGVTITSRLTGEERYDAVIFACHSDQALRLLADASPAESSLLGAIPYQENEAVLHTDSSVMPDRKLAWAAWNYQIPREPRQQVAVTYDMNILQSLPAAETFLVSLNCAQSIDPAKIIRRMVYHHPVYTPEGLAAQGRHGEISGMNRTYYCGAYWGFGFHEDGVKSGLRVAEQITGRNLHAQLPLRRAS